MNHFFLDTSYLVALELAKDQNHLSAQIFWNSLDKKQLKIITTSYVFDEVVTFLNSRKFHSKAVEIGNNLINSSIVQLIQVDELLFFTAWDYFVKHSDKSYSFTDCVSFVTMKQLNINYVLTFDVHFRQAGFTKLP